MSVMDLDQPKYSTAMVNLAQVKYRENGLYKACTSCKKKLQPDENGNLYCEKCDEVRSEYNWNLIMSVELTDCSDGLWATSFSESSEVLVGNSAAEIGEMRDNSLSLGSSNIEGALQKNLFKPFLVRLKTSSEIYNDEQRTKTVIVSCQKYNPVAYGQKLIQEINSFNIDM